VGVGRSQANSVVLANGTLESFPRFVIVLETCLLAADAAAAATTTLMMMTTSRQRADNERRERRTLGSDARGINVLRQGIIFLQRRLVCDIMIMRRRSCILGDVRPLNEQSVSSAGAAFQQ
jgi:hypothetical protein